MFCPQCRSEYPAGVTRCAECDVDLVAELPPAPSHETEGADLVPVLVTSDESRLAVAKSLLAAEGLPYVAEGEEGLELNATALVRLCVRPEDEQASRELLAHLEPLDESQDPPAG